MIIVALDVLQASGRIIVNIVSRISPATDFRHSPPRDRLDMFAPGFSPAKEDLSMCNFQTALTADRLSSFRAKCVLLALQPNVDVLPAATLDFR